MSNGQRCCILFVCCPPTGPNSDEKRIKALAEEMAEGIGADESYDGVARWIIDNFDLVPKGVGERIVEAYRPEFAKLHAHHDEAST